MGCAAMSPYGMEPPDERDRCSCRAGYEWCGQWFCRKCGRPCGPPEPWRMPRWGELMVVGACVVCVVLAVVLWIAKYWRGA